MLQKANHVLSDHWNMLSDEMVLNIFSWIPKPMLVKVARVCKRWERLSFDESLWRRMDLAGKVLKEEVLGRILDRGPAILRLAKAEVRNTSSHIQYRSGLDIGACPIAPGK